MGRGGSRPSSECSRASGPGAYLAPVGQEKAFYAHAGVASVDHSRETPAELLAVLHRAFGRFDLDPCAPRRSRTRVRALIHLTLENDGLAVAWHEAVLVYPPYGRTLSAWMAKCRREAESGRSRVVVALLPARPDTSNWHEYGAGEAAVYFLRGRLRFGDGESSAPFPSALAVWGAEAEVLAALTVALSGACSAG